MKPTVRHGNAAVDGAAHRSWFIGRFIDGIDDPRSNDKVEIKWGIHKAGEVKTSGLAHPDVTSVCVFLSGRFHFYFPDQDIVMSHEGDYVIWTGDVPYRWTAEEDSVVLTIRWPSVPQP